MSNITHNDELVTKTDLAGFYQGIYPYLNGAAHAGFTPVGTVISVMGNTAPANYLACNGQIVNIADYKELADYFEAQFGTKNHFGGDGTTTFAVPDLRGEFLRGTGTNSHENQGDGANVGVHQDGTEHVNNWMYENQFSTVYTGTGSNINPVNEDSVFGTLSAGQAYVRLATHESGQKQFYYTSRPTNTSVLYCIATKNIYIDARYDYSTDEQVVGTWIDSKPIYQKTFVDVLPQATQKGTYATNNVDVTNLNIDYVISLEAFAIFPTSNNGRAINYFPKVYNDGTVMLDANYRKDNVYNYEAVRISNANPDVNGQTVYITIQYTKTTD